MEEAELARIREQFAEKVHERFPDAPIERVEVLQYGDQPEIEPGQLLARVIIETPDDEPERLGRSTRSTTSTARPCTSLRQRARPAAGPGDPPVRGSGADPAGKGKPVIQLGQGPAARRPAAPASPR